MSTTAPQSDVETAAHDHAQFARLARLLNAGEDFQMSLAHPAGKPFAIPPSMLPLLRQLVEAFSEGRTVHLVEESGPLNVRAAAALLGTSVDYVNKLVQEGSLPSSGSGSMRFLRLEDVAAQRAQQRRTSEEAMRELVRLSEELGLYDWT